MPRIDLFDDGPLFDAGGNLLVGGTIEAFEAGTSTPLALYSDSALTVAYAPITASDGWLTQQVWGPVGYYKFVVKDAGGIVVKTLDNVTISATTGELSDPQNGIRYGADGEIRQWGTGTITTGEGSVVFPVTFPNEIEFVSVTERADVYTAVASLGIATPTVSGLTVYAINTSGSPAATSIFHWRALGR